MIDFQRYRKWVLGLILGLYLLITVGYGVINPLFEAPDEHHHFFTTLFIAENGRLPIADMQDDWLRQEAAQPPLTYILGAFLVNPIDTTAARSQLWRNPQASIGDASALTNINWAVHTVTEQFPWQNSVLAAHLLRLMSTAFGLGTLLCIYGSGRLVWPQQPEIALLATALVAFLPQFNFLHSAITNDTLIIFLCSAVLWQLLYGWQNGLENGRLLFLGITIGCAILTKNAGMLLLLYALGVLFLLWLKNDARHLKSLMFSWLWILVPALLFGGWFWLRNWQLYGDVTATNVFIEFAGGNRHASIFQVLGEWKGMWPSLFAIFGWFNIRPPQWVFWVWNGIVIGALVGFCYALIKKVKRGKLNLRFDVQQPWFIAIWLAGWVVAVYAGLVLFMLKTEAAQGRLLFPAIVPLALALAYGWSQFRWRGVYLLIPMLALITSLVSLFGVIYPAYALPDVVEVVPADTTSMMVDLGQGLHLVGADIETKTAVPGDDIWLTLYWQSENQLEEAPEFTLEILGRDAVRVGQEQGYHGRGLYPANLWPTQQIIADRFAIRLDDTIKTPVLATAYVGLVGETARATVGEIELEPAQWATNDAPPLAKIGDGIELTAVTINPETVAPGETVTVSLQWRVGNSPEQDYTTLVHLVHSDNQNQPPLATGDNQPIGGRYPTRLWQAGELIDDSYTLVIPDNAENGRYSILIGLYDPNTFARLPLSVNGQPANNQVYQAGGLDINN